MVKKNKNNKIGFIVNSVKTSDVEKTADFGTFKLSRTKDSIIFSTYMGYTVIINRYTMSPNGNVGDLSLFAWLDMMITESDNDGLCEAARLTWCRKGELDHVYTGDHC